MSVNSCPKKWSNCYDRLIEEKWIDGGVLVNTVTTAYDQQNRVYSIADDVSAYTYLYDDLDRVVEVRNFIDADNNGDPSEVGDTQTPGVAPVALFYAYDEDNRLIGLSAQIWDHDNDEWRDDFQNSYAYNGRDYLTTLTQQADTDGTVPNNAVAYKRIELIYDVADQLDQISRYASAGTSQLVATSSFQYDEAFRLTRLTHAQDTTVLADYDWQYDESNRVASFSSLVDGTAFYTYDDRDQLTGEFYVAQYRDSGGGYQTISSGGYSSTFQPNLAYQYDTNGNRKRRTEVDLPNIFNPSHMDFAPTTQFKPIGDANENESYTATGVTVTSTDDFNTDAGTHNRIETDGTHDYAFDAQGNQVRRTHIANDTVRVYEWDVKNRLVKVIEYASTSDADTETDPTQVVHHIYDMHSRWIGSKVDSDGDGVFDSTESYVYDIGQILLRFVDADGDGTTEDDELSNRYLWGERVDQLFADEQIEDLLTGGDLYWALSDNLGSVRDLAFYDESIGTTSVAEHLTYDAGGKITSESNAIDEFFKYNGFFIGSHWFDTTTQIMWVCVEASSGAAVWRSLYKRESGAIVLSPNGDGGVQAYNLQLSGNTLSATDTNGDVRLSPNGTGAISNGSGGARGDYATDFQRSRSSSSQVASGNYSAIAGGSDNTASGSWSAAAGKEAVADKYGQSAQSAGSFASAGDAQVSDFVLRKQITHNNTDWTALSTDGTSGLLTVPADTSWVFTVWIVGATFGQAKSFSFKIDGQIENDGGNNVIKNSTVTTIDNSDDPSFSARVSADNTNDALLVEVSDSDASGDVVRWVARVATTEVTYA